MVTNTADYAQKLQELLDPMMYIMLTKDPMQSIVRKTKLVMQSSCTQEVAMGDGRLGFQIIWATEDSQGDDPQSVPLVHRPTPWSNISPISWNHTWSDQLLHLRFSQLYRKTEWPHCRTHISCSVLMCFLYYGSRPSGLGIN